MLAKIEKMKYWFMLVSLFFNELDCVYTAGQLNTNICRLVIMGLLAMRERASATAAVLIHIFTAGCYILTWYFQFL